MADKIFNIRATSGYVSDTAGQTYWITDDTYSPGPASRDGHTFGWIDASQQANSNHRDRDNTNDPRLAGISFQANTGTLSKGRIDMTVGMTYDIRLALGDASNARTNTYLLLQDDSTTITTINVAGGTLAGEWIDATGVKRSSDADWISNNAAYRFTAASGIFYFTLGTPTSTGDVTALAHIALIEVATGDILMPQAVF